MVRRLHIGLREVQVGPGEGGIFLWYMLVDEFMAVVKEGLEGFVPRFKVCGGECKQLPYAATSKSLLLDATREKVRDPSLEFSSI